jgi:hypothetical protein
MPLLPLLPSAHPHWFGQLAALAGLGMLICKPFLSKKAQIGS